VTRPQSRRKSSSRLRAGAKRILLPCRASPTSRRSRRMFAKFQTSFYSDP
jgi:predicted ATP-dependent Lon-type protease